MAGLAYGNLPSRLFPGSSSLTLEFAMRQSLPFMQYSTD
jgi:hypothetical protein